MILILTMSVKYLANHLSILEAFVQNVSVRILGNRVFAVSKMQSMMQLQQMMYQKQVSCYTNLLKSCSMRIFRKLLQSILLTHVTRTLMSEATKSKKSFKGIFHNDKQICQKPSLGVTLGGSGVKKKFRSKENVDKISVKDCIFIKSI